MARELPIHNGRMTTDLDANGFKIKNLPPGSGFTQAQADWGQADTSAPDFVKNKPALAAVATSGSYDDLTGKPTIPSAVTIDATLAVQGAAADAKAVGDSLRSGFTEWEFSGSGYDPSITYSVYVEEYEGGVLIASLVGSDGTNETVGVDSLDVTSITFEFSEITATRHLITPTKTSQLTNDGDGTNAFVKTNDPRLSDARTPTAHHATHAANGSDPLAPADIGAAAASDLPYALVTPGEWAFSDGVAHTISGPRAEGGVYYYDLDDENESQQFNSEDAALAALSITFDLGLDGIITATRASLPGHLCDRAGNRVVVSGDTTLTLPAAVPGYLRDFLVRLEISGSTVPTITFAAPTGETITYETDGDEFPVPDEAGTWSYSFTENCVAHKFVVSLKKVNEVAAPQAQGGS